MKREDLIKQRKNNVKDMLMNVPRVNPDYGKDMDKDLFNARDNTFKGFQIEEFQNSGTPKKGNGNPKELNDILNNLRNRVGN